MNITRTSSLALLIALSLALSAGCSRVTATPPPPLTTTFPAGRDPRAEEILSVGPVRIFDSEFLLFQGTTKLPDGTPLRSQLYESGKVVAWWPAVQPITANNGTWEVKVRLGIDGAPARLAVGPSYLFKVWQVSDPTIQGLFPLDLVGPPSVSDTWWQHALTFIGDFFSDLFHGRLWRSPAPRATNSPIDRDTALMLAARNIPPEVVKEASNSAYLNEGVWRVTFFLPHGGVTADHLGWPDGPDTSFDNHGRLPPGSFSILTLFVSGTSGDVLLRQASDGIIVGPMDGQAEPPDNRVPPWTNIASGIVGLLVGGAIVWLVTRARVKTSKRPVGWVRPQP